MLASVTRACAVLALTVLSLLCCTSALAAPTTIGLRVEGASATLFEGPVAAEVPAGGIATPTSKTPHPCDFKDNGEHFGFGPEGVTPTAVLAEASAANGFAFDGEWSSGFNDFLITSVGHDAATGSEFWGYAVNFATAEVGGCQFALSAGSEVVWAFNYFNQTHLLSLTGPSTAATGEAVTFHVADGRTGEPIAGATLGEDVAGTTTPIAGAPVTDSRGDAHVALAHAGPVRVKATLAGSLRSQGVAVCVHSGADGTCGTTVTPAPTPTPTPEVTPSPAKVAEKAVIAGVKSGAVYSRRHAPRLLKGSVTVGSGATVRDVRLSLQRRQGHRCWVFIGAKASFVRARCGTEHLFSIGATASFTYLLPARLPAGSYVFDMEAVDGAGHVSPLVGGVSRVRFRVK